MKLTVRTSDIELFDPTSDVAEVLYYFDKCVDTEIWTEDGRMLSADEIDALRV
jgi:hypothetical protein